MNMANDGSVKSWIETLQYGDSLFLGGFKITKRQGRKLEITGDPSHVAIVRTNDKRVQYRRRQAREAKFRE